MVKEPAAHPETAKELPELVTTRTSRLMISVTMPITDMKRAATEVDVKMTVSAMEEEHVTGSDFVGEPQDSSKKTLLTLWLVY
jgi:hypothetical protein